MELVRLALEEEGSIAALAGNMTSMITCSLNG
jgi:hypothetical protein